MDSSPRSYRWQSAAAYAAIALLWSPIALLRAASRAGPEAVLRHVFGPYSRRDAFVGVDNLATFFFGLHTLLCVVALIAVVRRRLDVFVVLGIGPAVALSFYVLAEGFTDPAWFTIVALCAIGEMVSLVVGLLYWLVRRSPAKERAVSEEAPRIAS